MFDNLQDMTIDELVEEFGVTREQVQAVLDFDVRVPLKTHAPLRLPGMLSTAGH